MDKKVEKLLSSKKGDEFLRKLKDAAKSILGEKYLAEDAVQDTFEYFCHRDVPVKNAEEVEPYLLVTVRNRAIKMKKQHKQTTFVDIETLYNLETDDPYQSYEKQWQYDTMEQCIKLLDLKTRRVFRLRYLKGLDIKTVARMMNMSEIKVRRICRLAINEITKMVKDEQKKRK